eukprot:UN29915
MRSESQNIKNELIDCKNELKQCKQELKDEKVQSSNRIGILERQNNELNDIVENSRRRITMIREKENKYVNVESDMKILEEKIVY